MSTQNSSVASASLDTVADSSGCTSMSGINENFTISAILSEAWQKTSGAKWTIHSALLLVTLVCVVAITAVIAMASMAISDPSNLENLANVSGVQSFISNLLWQIVVSAIVGPLSAGVLMIGLLRSINQPIHAGMVFSYYHKIIPITVVMTLVYILVGIGFMLLVIPGLYLWVAYSFYLPLVVEKNMGPWEAMETSRKVVTKRWFSIFGLTLVLFLIHAATIFTLFIGMIWTVPFSVIAFGIAYRNLFGVSETQNA